MSRERIEEFVADYSFMDSNYAQLLDVLEIARGGVPERAHFMKDMDANVDRMKGWLIKHIGADWASATRPNRDSKLGIGRGVPPWEEVATTMSQSGKDAVPAFVSRHVRDLTKSFYRFS